MKHDFVRLEMHINVRFIWCFETRVLGLGFRASLWLCMRKIGRPSPKEKEKEKKKNVTSYPSLELKSWCSFIQTWGMLVNMGIHDAIRGLNPDEIDFTKVHSLPSWLKN